MTNYQPKKRYIKQFALALEKVYEPGAAIDMGNVHAGSCGTPGCFGWLTLRALEFISGKPRRGRYSYREEATALSNFLETGEVLTQTEAARAWTASSKSHIYGFCTSHLPLCLFAGNHPKWWGGSEGSYMFGCSSAFSPTGEYRKLKESDIVAWWIAVSRRPVPANKGADQ